MKKITENELVQALKYFKNNKSPGLDGYPIELYKIMWSKFKLPLLNSINYSLKIGNLSDTQKKE